MKITTSIDIKHSDNLARDLVIIVKTKHQNHVPIVISHLDEMLKEIKNEDDHE